MGKQYGLIDIINKVMDYANSRVNVALSSSIQNKVVIATAVAITNTDNYTYDLITHGGLTEDQIRQYKNFKISFYSTHNQTANVTVYSPLRALSATSTSAAGTIYYEANVLGASPNGQLILSSDAGGTGVNAGFKTVAALKSVLSNLIVRVAFGVAPASGSITIAVEMS